MTISSTLNIAKEALLAQQAAISVAGHNIANVNTPGYSRQVLNLTTPIASPSALGFFGNGVSVDSITRQYDQFMVQRQMDQNSTIKNLTTQQQSMQVIGTTFNEVSGLGINDMLSKFWDAWQALSNNPELNSNRQTVVQQAELLNDQFHTMNANLTQNRIDTGVALTAAIKDVNTLTKQIADLNAKIATSETPKQIQNDLRDTRDSLMTQLAGYINVNYYEAGNGALTVMMGDGHTLVNNNTAWGLDWANNTLQWINVDAHNTKVSTALNSSTFMGGSIGGLLQINDQLSESNPDSYVGRLNALANSLIREVNQKYSQGVGLDSFSSDMTSAERANDTTLLHTTVDTQTAASTLSASTFKINGRTIGQIAGSVITAGLVMGKTANAAQAINDATAQVLAKMTTLVAGNAVTAIDPAKDGETLNFTINGVAVSHKVDSTTGDNSAAGLSANLVSDINKAIKSYNDNDTNVPKLTITALVGNGNNGGNKNSIVLRNTNPGDESAIVVGSLASETPLGAVTQTINNIGLTAGSYQADKDHNTGELSLFSHAGPITIEGGANDNAMAQLGWAGTVTYSNQPVTADTADGVPSLISFDLNGKAIQVAIPDTSPPAKVAQLTVDQINLVANFTGVHAEVGDGTNGGPPGSVVFTSLTNNIKVTNYKVTTGTDVLGFSNFEKLGVASADETPGDGKLTYTSDDNKVSNTLMGLDYAEALKTDGGSFDLWLYNKDGSLALSQPVSIDLTRAYTLDDVVKTINASIANATNTSPASPLLWLKATTVDNQLVLKPDANHNFAFGNDTSNFLASMGINTFFSGYSVGTIDINQTVSGNLNNLAAGKINAAGEIFAGDNSNALQIANIQRDEHVTYKGRGGQTNTLDEFYNSLIGEIGMHGQSVNSELQYNQQVLDQLNELRDNASGVSLDEEMANLIKFQHAYSAAAKLISTSDEMMQTLLNVVR